MIPQCAGKTRRDCIRDVFFQNCDQGEAIPGSSVHPSAPSTPSTTSTSTSTSPSRASSASLAEVLQISLMQTDHPSTTAIPKNAGEDDKDVDDEGKEEEEEGEGDDGGGGENELEEIDGILGLQREKDGEGKDVEWISHGEFIRVSATLLSRSSSKKLRKLVLQQSSEQTMDEKCKGSSASSKRSHEDMEDTDKPCVPQVDLNKLNDMLKSLAQYVDSQEKGRIELWDVVSAIRNAEMKRWRKQVRGDEMMSPIGKNESRDRREEKRGVERWTEEMKDEKHRRRKIEKSALIDRVE